MDSKFKKSVDVISYLLQNKHLFYNEWNYFRKHSDDNLFTLKNKKVEEIIGNKEFEKLNNVVNYILEFKDDQQINKNLKSNIKLMIKLKDCYNKNNYPIFESKQMNFVYGGELINRMIDINKIKNLPTIKKYENIELQFFKK